MSQKDHDMTDSPLDLRHLDALLNPESIAIIGASDDPRRIGGRPLRYLAEAGYKGTIYPINPRYESVQGLPAFPSVTAVAGSIDLAIVALAAAGAVDAVRECVAVGVKVVVLFSAGFAEVGADGNALQDELRRTVQASDTRLLGPNCLGALNVDRRVMATFTTALDVHPALPGTIGFVTQSGAFGAHCISVARQRGLGFGKWITTGNEVDIDFADCLAYLAEDPETDVIVGYMEGSRNGDSLHAALALAQDRGKPVVLLKVGASEVGATAVASHTATLVGSDAAYDAVFARYGVHRASTISELLDVSEACAQGVLPRGNRIGLVTASGGIGILMADVAAEHQLQVAKMPEAAQLKLKELVPFAGVGNPVDVTAQTVNDPALLGQFLETMLLEGDYDLIVTYLGSVGLSWDLAQRFREPISGVRKRHPEVPIILSMIESQETHERFASDGMLSIPDPTDAVIAAAGLAGIGRGIHARRPAPLTGPSVPALPAGSLSEHDLKEILSKVGIPSLTEYVVTDEAAAVVAAARLGGAVAMKVASPRIAHKTEIGGVVLDVEGEDDVRRAFRDLLDRAARAVPGGDADGVLVAPMVTGGVELILGVHRDPVLGPLVMLGMGGTAAEALKDVSLRVPPFDEDEAHAMIRELRGWPLLSGWRGSLPVDVHAVAKALSSLSWVAVAWKDHIDSIDVNPLLALPEGQGVAALDALLVRRSADATGL